MEGGWFHSWWRVGGSTLPVRYQGIARPTPNSCQRQGLPCALRELAFTRCLARFGAFPRARCGSVQGVLFLCPAAAFTVAASDECGSVKGCRARAYVYALSREISVSFRVRGGGGRAVILRAVGSLRVFLFFCLAAAFNVAASDECVEVGVQGAKRVVECEFSFFARVPESNRGKGLEPLEGLNKVNKKKWGGGGGCRLVAILHAPRRKCVQK